MNTAPSNSGFGLPYPEYFGGVVSITPGQFRAANGFSNVFFGWGGEDDDFRHRVRTRLKGGEEPHLLDPSLGR